PPAPPDHRGQEIPYCRRKLSRRQINLGTAVNKISIPGNNATPAEAETNCLAAKTQNSRIAKTADRLITDRRTQSLSCVVNHADFPVADKLYDRANVRGIAKQMRDNDGLGFIGQYRLDCLCSDTEILTYVRQYGERAHSQNGRNDSGATKGGNHYFIAPPDVAGPQGDFQR